jgi:hypothetical protein
LSVLSIPIGGAPSKPRQRVRACRALARLSRDIAAAIRAGTEEKP